ncbi:MAG: hypothetical protein AB4368_06760 [Xenococcaceae cyanobacterium]
MEKYQILGVKEVWFWKNNQITFYYLKGDLYHEIATSKCLSNLASLNLASFVNRGLTESPLVIEADFIKQFE